MVVLKIKKLISITLIIVIALSLFPSTALGAIDSPDTIQIDQVGVYRNSIELLDQFYLVNYTLEYTVNPTAGDANELFIIRLMDGVTELGSTTIYPYFNDGYSQGIVSFYFSAADVTNLALGWGAVTGYTVSIEANPTLAWTDDPPPSTATAAFALWYDNTTVLATVDSLTTRMKAIANILTSDFSVILAEDVSGERKLTAFGEDYFTTTIPNLRLQCPALFATALNPTQFINEPIVQDMYVISDDNAYDAYGINWLAQVFQASDSYTSTGVRLKLKRIGSPGAVTVTIRNAAAGVPTGADLATSIIAGAVITNYLDGSWYDIYFGTDQALVDSHYYAIVLSVAGGDVNNYIQWRVDTGSAFTGGQACESADSGATWTPAAGAALPDAPSPLIDRDGIVDSSPLIGMSGLTASNLLIGGGSLGQDFMFAMQGWEILTAVYSETLAGRLLGGKFDMTPLARSFGMPVIWASSLVWLVFSIIIAVAVTRFTNSYKPAALIMMALMPLGGLMGFLPMTAAILVGMAGGGAMIYIFFFRSAA